jgi:S-disulfanyl-L-cysteine oxidoreductase SoxD
MFSRLLVVCLLGLSLTASWATARAQSLRAGVYTAEQAVRGQQQYDVFCTGCHGPEMEGAGVDVPALAEERFMRKWSGRPLRDLFDLIKMTMPENAPGSLSDRAYADLLASILQANGFPAGAQSLEPDRDRLATIVLEQVGQ